MGWKSENGCRASEKGGSEDSPVSPRSRPPNKSAKLGLGRKERREGREGERMTRLKIEIDRRG